MICLSETGMSWEKMEETPSPFHIAQGLHAGHDGLEGISYQETAGVLLLLHRPPGQKRGLHILLNKRSPYVRQPGDLCCPGGTLNPVLDPLLARLLRLPLRTLSRSPGWRLGKAKGAVWKKTIRLYWACALRESWEEMGLYPWRVSFLGPLPLYSLKLFQRRILPLVGWMEGQKRFRLNWEVSRLVSISIQELLEPANYGTYLLQYKDKTTGGQVEETPYPCFFFHGDSEESEVLWGATFHIVVSFLQRVFRFQPPPQIEAGRIVRGELGEDYFMAKRARERRGR